MLSSLLSDYLKFLRSPNLTPPPRPPSLRQIIIQTLRLYSLHLLLIIGVGVLIGQVLEEGDSLIPELFDEISPGALFFFAVVAAPIVEEILFRLPLCAGLVNLVLPGSLLLGLGLLWLTPLGSSEIVMIMALLAGFTLYLWRQRPPSRAIAQVYQRCPRLIFYTLTLLFGTIHITNYESQVWGLLPLLVLPQILAGLLFGFVRVRYGFGWAIALHAFHNGCILLPVLCLQVLGSPQLQRQGLENVDLSTLPWRDQFLLLGIGCYFLGGLILCLRATWELWRDGRKKTTH
ncbi:MAG: type II CAAX prenyl endopeptidase Rce1 family protein [Spirulinaceae cyanobacterium]